MGTLPGVPTSLPTKDSDKGFQDRVNGNYPKYKETDVNRLAVNEKVVVANSEPLELNPHSTLTIRRADRDISVGQADFNAVDIQVANSEPVALPTDDGTNFSEPTTDYNTKYPHNHVMETEGGHIREYDDTVGAKRIHERHASGSAYEIQDDGTKITRVKKDNYDLVTGDHFAHIKGNHSTTVDGGVRVFVNANASADSNYTIEVGNNANVNIQVNKGNVNVNTADGDINLKSGKDIVMDAAQGIYMRANLFSAEIDTFWLEKVSGINTKTGEKINLN